MRLFSSFFSDPNFVGSFSFDDKVYFFFREMAVENINCGKVKISAKLFLNLLSKTMTVFPAYQATVLEQYLSSYNDDDYLSQRGRQTEMKMSHFVLPNPLNLRVAKSPVKF